MKDIEYFSISMKNFSLYNEILMRLFKTFATL